MTSTILFNLIFTIVFYCTIPTILRFTVVKRKLLSKRQLLTIVIINGIIIFFMIRIADFILTNGNYSKFSLSPVILWSFVNYWILSSGNNKHHIKNTPQKDCNGKISANDSTYTYTNTTVNVKDKWITKRKDGKNAIREDVAESHTYTPSTSSEVQSTIDTPEPKANESKIIQNEVEYSKNKPVLINTNERGRRKIKVLHIVCAILFIIASALAAVVFTNYDDWKTAQIEDELYNTNAIAKGNLDYIAELREELLSHGGDADKFDSYVLNEVKNSFVNSIGSDNSTKLYAYRNYLLDNGYTQDMITQELIINSSTAYRFQEAVRAGNENEAVTQLSYLRDAGIEYEDANQLYKDAFR